MTSPRIDVFREMVRKNPENHLAHFGLANEALKLGLNEEAATHLREYLARYDDEGNGWGRLGDALAAIGRTDEAKEAYTRGVEASYRFGHPSMAAELEEKLEEL